MWLFGNPGTVGSKPHSWQLERPCKRAMSASSKLVSCKEVKNGSRAKKCDCESGQKNGLMHIRKRNWHNQQHALTLEMPNE